MSLQGRLSAFYLETHPGDAARSLEAMPLHQAAAALAAAEPRAASDVLACTEPGRAASTLLLCSEDRISAIVDVLPLASAARILRRMEPGIRGRLLAVASREDLRRLQRLLAWPEGTAGALMDPAVVSLPGDLEAGEAVRRLRERNQPVRYYVYVCDRDQHLVGVVTLRELLSAPRRALLAEIGRRPVDHVLVEDGHATILQHPGWHSFHALPVTDRSDVLVGVLRYETAKRLQKDAATDPTPDLMALGASMGEAWIRLTATVLDGLSSGSGTRRDSGSPATNGAHRDE